MSGIMGGIGGRMGTERAALDCLSAGEFGADGSTQAENSCAFSPSVVEPLVHQAVADAVREAVGRLRCEAGLPGFAAEAIHTQLDAITAAWQGTRSAALGAGDSAASSPTAAAAGACGNAIRAFGNELADAIVQSVRVQIQAEGDGGDAGANTPTKASGGSWMQAIARAMGQVLGNKASRMVELSQQIQDLSDRSRTAAGDGTTPPDDAGRAQQLQDAADSQRLNTEFQATGQEFNLLQTTFSTAMKTLGEGMASIARRQ